MKGPMDEVVMRGLWGGLLAGLVVAVWFLAVDLIQGQPFQTPAVLAYFFFDRETLTASAELVALYSVLHFGVFALLGVLFAWGLALLDTAPSLLLGAAFGVIVLDLVFYGALVAGGAQIFGVLPGVHVLGANLLGGVVLMGYLHRSGREPTAFGLGVLRGKPQVTEGLITGLIGAAAVALWFFVVDVAIGQPLRTPASLAASLFMSAQAPVPPTLALVLAYTMVHLAVFLGFGVLLVGLARGVERAPNLTIIFVLTCILLEALVIGTLTSSSEWVLGTLEWWNVTIANVIAVVAMGWRIWHTHPRLRHVMSEPAHQQP